MRAFSLGLPLAVAALVTAVAPLANARSFWQTYGSVAPLGTDGCAWNLNQDYFVPRTCDSCRYDLFSPCKESHTLSPACRNLHPAYPGYCTPYGACRYRWRDHVYKIHCGCTPLRCLYGPWKLAKCCKHCAKGCPGLPGCVDATCAVAGCLIERGLSGACPAGDACEMSVDSGEMVGLANLEPLDGETLGTLPAVMAAAGGARGGSSGGGGSLPPSAPASPAANGASFGIPLSVGN